MELHNLKPNTGNRGKKRIGRGGKRGTYSGRGQKGQHAHAGRRIPSSVRETLSKFPKFRGSRNRRRSTPVLEIHLNRLGSYADGEGKLSMQIFLERGFIKSLSEKVKILSGGEPSGAFTIEGIPVSKGARAKIEAKGGAVR